MVYSSPCPIHLHYFDNTTAPLLILQDNNDPRRRPSPCGEGSVRYMRAFTKAAIAAVRSSSSSSSSSSGTSISSKSSSNRSITRNYSSSSAGNAEREQQRSTRSRPQLQIKPRDTPAAPFSCCILSGMSVGEPYYDVRKTPRATSRKAPSANAPSTRKKQEARRSKKQEEEGSRQLRPMRLAKKARWRMKDGPHYLFWM